MARAVAHVSNKKPWDEIPDFVQRVHSMRATAALDALLDYLDENAEAFDLAEVRGQGVDRAVVVPSISSLINALREDSISKET